MTPTVRWIATAATAVAAILLGTLASMLLRRRAEDATARYHIRKVVRYTTAFLVVVALAVIWRAFAGRVGVVVGLLAAGVAFAMQEVIGAIAGWVNILSGRIYRVGDRIELGGVGGDVIDVTLLRTKILEMGQDPAVGGPSDESEGDGATGSWVHGRQYTGRVVTLSNKKTFTEPVYNYSALLEFLWEEITIPVAFTADVKAAERILLEEARTASATADAGRAIRDIRRRYPVPITEVEPRVFWRATDNYLQLSARFVVPVRTARTAKSELTRRVLERFAGAGIAVASSTVDVTVRPDEQRAEPDRAERREAG
jgi:small-conductance mechanosensitive channel